MQKGRPQKEIQAVTTNNLTLYTLLYKLKWLPGPRRVEIYMWDASEELNSTDSTL